MARLLFDATELESFWCSTMQSYQKLSAKNPASKKVGKLCLNWLIYTVRWTLVHQAHLLRHICKGVEVQAF